MRRLALLVIGAATACTPVRPLLDPPPITGTAAERGSFQPVASLVRIHKAARMLEVWAGSQRLLALNHVQLGRDPHGSKQFEGDGKTPEGRYLIDWRNPRSAYHLSLHVSYPNGQQVFAARAQGRSAGGMIMIHGQPNGTAGRVSGDWTDGCIAVSNAEIEALWDIVPDGTVVEILP